MLAIEYTAILILTKMKLLNYTNKLLYIFELVKDLDIKIENPMKMVEDVEIKKICFK